MLDRNSAIGLLLIFGLFFLWAKMNAPSPEEVAERQRLEDSLQRLALAEREVKPDTSVVVPDVETREPTVDTVAQALLNTEVYGPFSRHASGSEEILTLENELIKVFFSSRGGRIVDVVLKHYDKMIRDEEHEELKTPLHLLNDEKDNFEYLLPMAGTSSGFVATGDLIFETEKSDSEIRFQLRTDEGRSFAQVYRIKPDSYDLDYYLEFNDLAPLLNPVKPEIVLNWENYLDKIEINTSYEKNFSSTYFKAAGEKVDYCSRTGDDVEEINAPVEWVSHSNQFFNSTLIAKDGFASAILETKREPDESEDLKYLKSMLAISVTGESPERHEMNFYLGPNEFSTLRSYHTSLEDIIPFGWSIFGTVNRWVIRPLFNSLATFIGSMGIVILVLTFIVKMLLYPLTYRMLYSQAKMASLKPEISSLREKYKGDQQKLQMETMKIYREFGVNPLGGCMPMILQMPIWFALYRFFPAAIEFRQAPFLWANDLSSYDVFAFLPFEIPFYGDHLSLFTLLWAGTTVLYTYYNTRIMDMSAAMNPMMKYMQYLMPIMFLFFFNNYASGLTCYLLFSNLFNIAQTIATKNFILDHDKIKSELQAYKKKPKKKKKGFQARLESALREQQRIAQEKDKQKKVKKK